jgi:hypothetical protein
MSSSVDLHLAYKVANAPINPYPFPHFYVEEVLPPEYYAELQSMLPDPLRLVPIGEARPLTGGKDMYKERFVLTFGGDLFAALPPAQQAFWGALHDRLVGGAFRRVLLEKFGAYLAQRFQGQRVEFYDETLLVQDTTHYALGPHSDVPRKVITLLFYLPKDDSQRHLGTSIYMPKDRAFRCGGGPHYPHEKFDRVWTMPFMPNTLFVFLKTNASFHGVEPIADPQTRRWLLLYDIFHRVLPAEGAA